MSKPTGKLIRVTPEGIGAVPTSSIVQTTGSSTTQVMSQKATVEYVGTADVSNTKIDGKAIKTYIADAVKAGGSIPNDATSVGSIAMVFCHGYRSSKSTPPAFKAIGTNGKFSNGYESDFTAKYGSLWRKITPVLLEDEELKGVISGGALSGTWVNLSAPAKLDSGGSTGINWKSISLIGIARRVA